MPRNTSVRPLKQPILDDHVLASVNCTDGAYDTETGHYGEIRYVGCASRDRAKEIVQGLHRAAKRQEVSMAARIESAGVDEEPGTFTVIYSAVNKQHARAYVLAKYGSDRSKWPYSPIKGDVNYGV
jgi:hypothetical protein